MATEAKESAAEAFDVGPITEKLPRWELWEDGVEPLEEDIGAVEHERTP
jgi:hypothetical protein